MRKLQTAVSATFESAHWGKYHSLHNLCLALVSEVGELTHPIRWGPEWPEYSTADLETEVADVLILTLEIASVLDLDAEEIVLRKLETVRRRHGIRGISGDEAAPRG